MLRADLLYALRALLRARRVSSVAVALTLALVLGVVTCIFSLVEAVFLRPLPFADADRLVTLRLDRDGYPDDLPYPLYADFSNSRATTGLAALRFERDGLLLREWSPVRVAVVTTNLFHVLDAPLTLGRRFVSTDESASERPVILSHSAWKRLFAADRHVVGRRIRLSHNFSEASELLSVVGVTGASLASPDGPGIDMFVAEARSEPSRRSWMSHNWYVLGRLSSGATPEDLRAELDNRLQRWKAAMSAYGPVRVSVEGLLDRQVRSWRQRLYALLVASVLVLVLACANVGTLVLGVGRMRQREFATRIALGASPAQVMRQVLFENVILAVVGGLGAVALVKLCLPLLLALVPADVPRVEGVGLDWQVFGFALGASIVCGLLFGATPAIALSHEAPHSVIRGAAEAGGRSMLWTEGLLSLQLALALGLTTGCALAIVSEWRLVHAPLGFATSNVLAAEMTVGTRFPTPEAYSRFQERALSAARSLPEVADAALVDVAPPTPTGLIILDAADGSRTFLLERVVSRQYFRLLGIPLLFGRTPIAGEHTGEVAVVNAGLAFRWFGRTSVVGQSFLYGDKRLRIIGVVQDSREWSLRDQPRPTLYRFYGTGWGGPLFTAQHLLVKTRFAAGRTGPRLRDELRRLVPDMPVTIYPLDTKMLKDTAETRFYSRLLLLFAGFTVIVAAIGVGAIVTQTIARRRREIAIRLALGGSVRRVRMQLVRRVVVACAVGVTGGLLLARLLGSLLETALYDVSPGDPETFIAATLFLLGIAAAASYAPLRTVDGNNLNSVLRSE